MKQSLKEYTNLYSSVRNLLTEARRHTARSVNAILTATYWEIGRRIVEFEQRGARRAGYGEELLVRLSKDLSEQFGRGFSRQNLDLFRRFYLVYQGVKKCQALPSIFKQKSEALPRKSSKRLNSNSTLDLATLSDAFPLSWTHYTLLVRRIRSNEARQFYEEEALRCGWSTRQLQRQIESQFYERTVLSRNKAKMLKNGENPPVGIILCAHKDSAVVRYALDGLPNKVLASEYKTILPSEQTIAEEIEQTKKLLEERKQIRS